ncbi:MAG TPA: hypothetical protein VJP88_08645 [Caulobacteraceae bacterium]|nr:hypothetical protein [Caulobacteraceae bacterium]
MPDTSTLAAQYAWAGADDADKRAVSAIFRRFEDLALGSAWAAIVGASWEHWRVHAYYVTAGRDLERAVEDIISQVRFRS